MLTLYDYWRSSAAFRVRIALNLKGLAYRQVPINIAPTALEQRSDAYSALNPQMRVPALLAPQGVLTQSLAIIEWLEETYPEPALLPADPWLRAQVRSFAMTIAADIHPLNNSSVLGWLAEHVAASEEQRTAWYRHWISLGFAALEQNLAQRPVTAFAFGETPGLAEIFLVPQCYNARRYGLSLTPFPRLSQLDEAASALPPFAAAAPERQQDARPAST